jgi:hypothetical protein
MNALRKITGEPVIVHPTTYSTPKPARVVHVYGDITDEQLQAHAALTDGGKPEQYGVRWLAA